MDALELAAIFRLAYAEKKTVMRVEQIYTSCLSGASYYIESAGEAAIIDPLRDVAAYLLRANRSGAKIRYIFETHFHADYVGGHSELARNTSATIVFGPTAAPAHKAHIAYDGETFRIGNVCVQALHTPGHSLESTCWLLKDEAGTDYAVFTGDTLFIDAAGRPDLVQQLRPEFTPRFLAGLLYDSLRNKIMPLSDELLVYPAHGAGSPCGKNISAKTFDSLGAQRNTNPALSLTLSREDFIEQSMADLEQPPAYFPFNIISNAAAELPSMDEILIKGSTALPPKIFLDLWKNESAQVIDMRQTDEFAGGFIPGSLPVSPGSDFGSRMARLVPDMRQPLLLITDKSEVDERIVQLARIGYHHIAGYLSGGIESWVEEGFETISLNKLSFSDYKPQVKQTRHLVVLDLRSSEKMELNPVRSALRMEFNALIREAPQLDNKKTFMVYADDQPAAIIAAAILCRAGKNCKLLL
ncbi:MAG: MBL fold metallo-hydrolase [Chitinophagaceae bacterium]